MKKLHYVAKFVMFCALCALTSGCFLSSVLSRVFVSSFKEQIHAIVDLAFSGGTGAVCFQRSSGFRTCDYFINGVEVA